MPSSGFASITRDLAVRNLKESMARRLEARLAEAAERTKRIERLSQVTQEKGSKRKPRRRIFSLLLVLIQSSIKLLLPASS